MDRRRLLGALAAVPTALALGAAAKKEPRASRRRKGAKAPEKHVDVAVVGAGAIGAWTAWHLVRQGRSVRLFDAYGAGNGRAASNLPTMLLDPVQDGDALYAGLVEDSIEAWQRLSDSASLPIVTRCETVTTQAA
ncbi:MAG: FAD-dependent oxidoreductase, partial [Sphingopyxis granuli]